MSDLTENQVVDTATFDLKYKFEIAYKMNEYIQDLIVFSDQKANFIAAISLGLLAGNFVILTSNYNGLRKVLSDLTFQNGLFIGLYFIFLMIVLILQGLSFFKAINVVKPSTSNTSKKPSIFYFREIANQNHEDFREKFATKTEGNFLDDLIYQAYDKSVVCQAKFDLVNSSILFLKINLLLTIIHPFINLYINLK